MATRIRFACLILTVLCASSAFAWVGSGGTRDAIVYAPDLTSWSIGIEALSAKRGVNLSEGQDSIINVQSAAVVIGYDATTFLTLFGTAGAAQLQEPWESDYGPTVFKWSAGLRANLWRTDVHEPEFMAGTLIWKFIAEYNEYDFSSKADYTYKAKWSDIWITIPFSYELYVENEDATARVPYSLMLSIGPAVSILDGEWMESISFKEKSSLGVVGGVDLYMAHNLSFGATVRYFDEVTTTGTISFHF